MRVLTATIIHPPLPPGTGINHVGKNDRTDLNLDIAVR